MPTKIPDEIKEVQSYRFHCGNCSVDTMRIIHRHEGGFLIKCDICGKELIWPYCQKCGKKVVTTHFKGKFLCGDCFPKNLFPIEEVL